MGIGGITPSHETQTRRVKSSYPAAEKWDDYPGSWSAPSGWSADLARPVVPYAAYGSPMKRATMKATMERLGVIASFSRPRV